jgi:hypothetical protein
MRTKALLCLAAVAAIAIPASAQVYSANIVGYYNVQLPGSLNALTVSLKNGANRADQVIPYTTGDNIQVWTGTGWALYSMDDLAASGWLDGTGAEVPVTSLPTLGLGKGFFYGKNGSLTSLTIVGEVLKGTNTVALTSGLNAVGSQLPIAGVVNGAGDANISGVNLQVPNGSNVQFWTGSKWALYGADDISSTGWVDDNGSDVAAPTVAVGQGFFFGNNTGAGQNWTQWYNY